VPVSVSCHAAVSTQLNAIFVSLELSRSTWLVTSLSPGRGERISRHQVKGSDVPALLERFAQLQAKAEARMGEQYPLVVIQEAGLDGFWIHRCLVREGIESYVGAPQGLSYGQRQSEQMVNKSLSVAAKYIKFRGFVRLDELEVTGSPLVMFHPRSS